MPKQRPEVRIRLMQGTDAEQVRELDQQAFGKYLSATTPRRSSAHIQACIAMNPQGCFVAEADHPTGPVGYLFSRVWGSVGWIGTFGVHPENAASGVGSALLTTAVSALRSSGCAVIGLETMPYSETNVGFYLRNGFVLMEPTLVLVREGQGEASFPDIAQPLTGDLSVVTTISQAASPGLDYRGDAESARAHGWGMTFQFGDHHSGAIAIVRTRPPREYARVKFLEVTALVTAAPARASLAEALGTLEQVGLARHLEGVQLSVSAAQPRAIDFLLERGYRVRSTLLRMRLPGAPQALEGFDLSQWAM
jgi:ribosomal protein S18 acetylase RimI-like enzyme